MPRPRKSGAAANLRVVGEVTSSRESGCNDRSGGVDLREQIADVEAAVFRRVRPEPAGCLLQLPLAADPVSAAGLVPGDRDVDEPLEEIALGRLRRPPGGLELLVRLEVLAGPDQL